MNFDSKIYRRHKRYGWYCNNIKKDDSIGLQKFNFTNSSRIRFIKPKKVQSFFRTEKLDYVIIAAAKVGGINANNNFRGQFIYENLEQAKST